MCQIYKTSVIDKLTFRPEADNCGHKVGQQHHSCFMHTLPNNSRVFNLISIRIVIFKEVEAEVVEVTAPHFFARTSILIS